MKIPSSSGESIFLFSSLNGDIARMDTMSEKFSSISWDFFHACNEDQNKGFLKDSKLLLLDNLTMITRS